MLRHRRLRLQEIEAAEAQGGSFWSESIDQDARVGLLHAYTNAPRQFHDRTGSYPNVWDSLRALLLVEFDQLRSLAGGAISQVDVEAFFLNNDDLTATAVIEGMHLTLIEKLDDEAVRGFEKIVNALFEERRISFELVNGLVVEKESQELHSEVVAPTLRLLSGRAGWESVEGAYQAALGELHGGDPADAITDAGRALQLTLELLGCSGSKLGPLIASARSLGLLAPHDSQLENALVGMMHWASADSSKKGDRHVDSDAVKEDAWLTVHVVGALILRLVAGTER